MRATISLCMIVNNEERLLGHCLKSVRTLVDEIVIVDQGSTDRTPNIARAFGARVISHAWDESEGRARNLSIRHARGSWVLVLDADESMAQKDLANLKRLTKNTRYMGYHFTCRDYTKMYNLSLDWHPNDRRYPKEEKFSQCPGWSQYKIFRLFRRKEGVQYEEGNWPHTTLLPSIRKLKGTIQDADIVVHHFQYLKGGDAFVVGKQHGRLNHVLRHARHSPSPKACLDAGITLFELSRDDRAIRYLKKAIKLDKEYAKAYVVLGMVYKECGNYEQASRYLEKATHQCPQSADAWAVLGITYDMWGKSKKAESALRRAVYLCPVHLLARNALGVFYQNRGDLLNAERELKRCLEIHPEFPDASFNLAVLYESQGKFHEASHYYRRVLKTNPYDNEATDRLMRIRNHLCASNFK